MTSEYGTIKLSQYLLNEVRELIKDTSEVNHGFCVEAKERGRVYKCGICIQGIPTQSLKAAIQEFVCTKCNNPHFVCDSCRGNDHGFEKLPEKTSALLEVSNVIACTTCAKRTSGKLCKKCGHARYCSVECRKLDKDRHKATCRGLRRLCHNCNVQHGRKHCRGCEQARYCGRDCQLEHWGKVHKFMCPASHHMTAGYEKINETRILMEKDEMHKLTTVAFLRLCISNLRRCRIDGFELALQKCGGCRALDSAGDIYDLNEALFDFGQTNLLSDSLIVEIEASADHAWKMLQRIGITSIASFLEKYDKINSMLRLQCLSDMLDPDFKARCGRLSELQKDVDIFPILPYDRKGCNFAKHSPYIEGFNAFALISMKQVAMELSQEKSAARGKEDQDQESAGYPARRIAQRDNRVG